MPAEKKVDNFMIPLEDYPHIPYWFTLRQAMAIIREAAIKFEGSFEPRSVLVFDEKYQLMEILTLRDIIKGLEPKFLQEGGLVKMDPSLTVLMGDLFVVRTAGLVLEPTSLGSLKYAVAHLHVPLLVIKGHEPGERGTQGHHPGGPGAPGTGSRPGRKL